MALTTASILVAIGLGIVGYLHARHLSRRSHTVTLLSMISSSDRIANSEFSMTRLINSGTRLDGAIDDETDRFVINLLDFYEFLATSWACGSVDGDILLHVRGGAMSRAFDVCERYISDRRQSLQAPNLYKNLEDLVKLYRSRGLGL